MRRLFISELEVRFENLLPGHGDAAALRRAAHAVEKLPRAQQNLALHWVEVAAQSSYEIALNIAFLAESALEVLDDDGFQTWVLGGLERKDQEGQASAVDYLRDLTGFITRHLHAAAGTTFADVEMHARTFSQALSGRMLEVKPGKRAWTDTETFYLPEELAAVDDPAGNRRLYKIMTAMLWAQNEYGTFSGMSTDLEDILYKYPDIERAMRWLAALEAVRLEGRLAVDLPGLAREIAAVRGAWPAALATLAPRLSMPGATLADTLVVLEEVLAGAADAPLLAHAAGIDASVAIRTLRAQERRDGKPRFGAAEMEFDPFPAEFDEGEAFGLGRDVLDLAPSGNRSAVSTLSRNPGRPDDVANPGMKRGIDLLQEPDHTYDEWDFRRGVYKKDWCQLYEIPVKPGDPAYVDQVKRKYRVYIQQIRRQLEMIKGEDKVLSRQVDGEEMDVDAVVESFIDHRSGNEPSDRLFRRRVRNERSLAVMFMVDMSGSTKGWVNNAERESLILLCEALELLNDNYAIYGFSGWGHTRCEIYPVKGFGEAYDANVRARIAGIEGKDFTRMGVAVRHLSRLLEEQPARHHLLVTISDGYPDDYGGEYRSDYGIEDTRRALQESHERGVRSFCVTIDRQGADYLERLYGPARYEVVANAHKLPLRMAEIYRHLTT